MNTNAPVARPRLLAIVAVFLALLGAGEGRASSIVVAGSVSGSIAYQYEAASSFLAGSDVSTTATLSLVSNLNLPKTIETAADSTELIFRITAPEGFRLAIDPLNDGTYFFLNALYRGPGDSTGLTLGEPTVRFTSLLGKAPTFANYSSFYRDATLALFLQAENVEAFSFTALEFIFPLSGTGNARALTLWENPTMALQDQNYTGEAPPEHAPMLTMMAAVPEPSAALSVLSGIVVLLARRRRW